MKLINCTASVVALIDGAGTVVYFAPAPVGRHAGVAPRHAERVGPRGGVACYLAQLAEVVNLPAPQEGTYCLCDSGVALLAAQAQRWDVVAPDPETAVQLPGDPFQIAFRALMAFDGGPSVGLGLFAVG